MTSRSKFGACYKMSDIKAAEKEYTRELKAMRRAGRNRFCADCDRKHTSWASVNIGCFLCIECAQVHRAMGTHISRVKNCLGTYLWHPDEMDAMRKAGNHMSSSIYGGPVLDRDSRQYTQQEALPILLSKYSKQKKQMSAAEEKVAESQSVVARKIRKVRAGPKIPGKPKNKKK